MYRQFNPCDLSLKTTASDQLERLRRLRGWDLAAAASAVVATVYAWWTERLPGLIIGLAVVVCVGAILQRKVVDACRMGREMERDAQARRRRHAYRVLRSVHTQPPDRKSVV